MLQVFHMSLQLPVSPRHETACFIAHQTLDIIFISLQCEI